MADKLQKLVLASDDFVMHREIDVDHPDSPRSKYGSWALSDPSPGIRTVGMWDVYYGIHILLVVTEDGHYEIYRSTDLVEYYLVHRHDTAIYTMVYLEEGKMLFSAEDGWWKTEDTGLTWSSIGSGPIALDAVAIAITYTSWLLVAYDKKHVLHSRDYPGGVWSESFDTHTICTDVWYPALAGSAECALVGAGSKLLRADFSNPSKLSNHLYPSPEDIKNLTQIAEFKGSIKRILVTNQSSRPVFIIEVELELSGVSNLYLSDDLGDTIAPTLSCVRPMLAVQSVQPDGEGEIQTTVAVLGAGTGNSPAFYTIFGWGDQKGPGSAVLSEVNPEVNSEVNAQVFEWWTYSFPDQPEGDWFYAPIPTGYRGAVGWPGWQDPWPTYYWFFKIPPSRGHRRQLALKSPIHRRPDFTKVERFEVKADVVYILTDLSDTPNIGDQPAQISLIPVCGNWLFKIWERKDGEPFSTERHQTYSVLGAFATIRSIKVPTLAFIVKTMKQSSEVSALIQGLSMVKIVHKAAVQGTTNAKSAMLVAIQDNFRQEKPKLVAAVSKCFGKSLSLTASFSKLQVKPAHLACAIEGNNSISFGVTTLVVKDRTSRIYLEFENLWPQEFDLRGIPNWPSKVKDWRIKQLR